MPSDRPLNDEERDELLAAADQVGLPDLDALQELVDAARAGEVELDDELLFHVGAWFGERAREATGWRWVLARLGEGLEAPALVPEDRSVALLPLQLVAGVLEGTHDDVLRTVLTRLLDGQRPSGPPRSYAIIG